MLILAYGANPFKRGTADKKIFPSFMQQNGILGCLIGRKAFSVLIMGLLYCYDAIN